METGSGVRRPRSTYIEYLEKRIAPATFVVTNLNDAGAGSLRDAVDKANAASGADTIVFKGAATSGEIALTTGEIDITDSVNIKGPGATKLAIDAQDLSRIFNIDDGTTAVKNITISGLSILDGNSITENGGGIYCLESLTLVNSVVSGCRAPAASGYGGGLYIITNGQAIIRNSKITGNMAGSGAAGMRADAEAGVQIINSVISGNSGTRLGGGVYAHIHSGGTGNILITGSTITDNIAARGGGLNLDNDAPTTGGNRGKIIIRDTLISGNSATAESMGLTRNGGGLYFDDGNALIDHCTITNNVATDHGGGLNTNRIDSVIIKNSKIIGNRTTSATGSGGGVYIDGGGNGANIQRTLISGNVSAGDGGGVFFLNGSLTVQKSTISYNQSGAYGGGIGTTGTGSEKADVRVTNSLFTFNRATYGGGLDTHGDGSVSVAGSRFLQNVTTVADGGGLYLRSTAGVISIANSLIAQNTSGDDGGGVALHGGTAPITITNTVINDNSAADDGGGIALFGGTLRVATSTVTGNIAASRGGGIWSQSDVRISVSGSKVTDNIAPTGPQIFEPPA